MNLQDALDVQRATRWKKLRAEYGRKVCLGLETRPSWKGSSLFYLFKCPSCQRLVKDYSHGHPERRYLSCPECGKKIDFVDFWVKVRTFFSIVEVLL